MWINAKFEKCADHAIGFLASDRSFFDFSSWQLGTWFCDDDFLAFGHIGRSTYDLNDLIAQVDFSDMKMIGVWMHFAFYDLSDH